jgi:hypothetical protein
MENSYYYICYIISLLPSNSINSISGHLILHVKVMNRSGGPYTRHIAIHHDSFESYIVCNLCDSMVRLLFCQFDILV